MYANSNFPSPQMNSYLKYALKLEKLFVVRIEVIVNLTTCSLRLVYHQIRL